MEKGKDILEFFFANPNMKEIARARELGEYAYNTEIRAAWEEGYAIGFQEGLEEVRAKRFREAARKLLAAGFSRERVEELLEIKLKYLDE